MSGGLQAHRTLRKADPVPDFWQWIAPLEIIVIGSRHGRKHLQQRTQTARVLPWISRGSAFTNFDEVAEIAEKPTAANPNPVTGGRLNVRVFGHVRQQGREVHA
jgi:hypothetical protein